MKNINDIVKYMRRRSEDLTGVSMVIPISKPLWDHIMKMLESYCLKTDLPGESGEYLCLCDNGRFSVLPYSNKYKKFNCHDDDERTPFVINVVAWCELPEVVKDERVVEG